MTARNWIGGNGDFLAAASWSPAGRPAAGDALTIGNGVYGYAESPALVGLAIRYATPASDPGILGFNDAVVTDTRFVAKMAAHGGVQFYGETTLQGGSSLVASGAGSELVVGIGKDTGDYNTFQPGLLTNTAADGFRAEGGGSLILGDIGITGGSGTIANDGGATVTGEGSYMLLNTAVAGTGRIDVAAGGQLDANERVGAGQTVRYDGTGNLVVLYAAHLFEGVLSNMVAGNALWLGQQAEFGYVADSVRYAGGVLEILLGGREVASLRLDLPARTGFALSRFEVGPYSYVSITSDAVVCFATGTRILTAAVEVAVEALRPGDRVATLHGGLAAIVWVGRRTVDLRARPDARPVRIAAGAFGPGLPHRPLRVSPEHALLFDGALVPARLLVNGGSVRVESPARITYWHVELARHDVLLADGMPAESWLDCGNRNGFDACGAPQRAGPTEPCAPRLLGGPALLALHERFAPPVARAA